MVSKRTTRVLNIYFTLMSLSGFVPYKWDALNYRIRKSTRYGAKILSVLISVFHIIVFLQYSLNLIFNMTRRVTQLSEIIVGICFLSYNAVAMLGLALLVLAVTDAVQVVNDVLYLAQILGRYLRIWSK